MQEIVCDQCLGLGSHPFEDQETNEYKSVNCSKCCGSGIIIQTEWRPIRLCDVKKLEAVKNIESQFLNTKEGHNGIK